MTTVSPIAQPAATRSVHPAIALLRQPETIAAALLVVAFIIAAITSPYFLDVRFLLDSTSQRMEIGVMALAMTLVIISGNIDLSVASALALIAVVAGRLHEAGLSMGAVIPLALVLGLLLGSFNGVLIAKLRLPSLTVTLGTLALYLGVAQALVGERSLGHFPDWFVGIDYRYLAGIIPLPLVIFLSVACVFAILLHRTVFGRCIYAIGTNESASRFSGLRVDRVKLAVFAISGLMSGVAALMMLSRLNSARYNMAIGEELAVITAVVLGGTDIFGGRGTIFGTVVALLLLIILRTGMGVQNVRAENQLAINGSLLIVAVLLGNLMKSFGTRSRKQ